MTHAPSRNFVIDTTKSTTSVSVAPTPLTNAPRRQPRVRSRRHLMTMPVWDSVNDTKTPSMYSGISLCVSPPKATSKTPERQLSMTMPFENARRSP